MKSQWVRHHLRDSLVDVCSSMPSSPNSPQHFVALVPSPPVSSLVGRAASAKPTSTLDLARKTVESNLHDKSAPTRLAFIPTCTFTLNQYNVTARLNPVLVS